MSRATPRSLLLLGICAVVATGCGSSDSGTAPTTSATSMSPGMRMPGGSTGDARVPTVPRREGHPGAGEVAYLSPDGVVGLVKDNVTLVVDATGLPVEFGPERQQRTDFAYEVATVVLGCWTEHG